MATASNDENKLKECLQLLIDAVSHTISQSDGETNSPQLINDLGKAIKTIANKSFSSLSKQCQNYLFNILREYGYNETNKTLSDSFTSDMLESFLQDLQGVLASLDVFHAAWDGNQEVIEAFHENYPQLMDKSSPYETTVLYCAARNNHLDLVKYLIEEAGCSVNAQNQSYDPPDQSGDTKKAIIGSTALHAACYQGHRDVVTYLISHGGDYFLLNSINETPVQNGKSKHNIRGFFQDFLLPSYSTNSTELPKKTILQEVEGQRGLAVDCIWEYKPLAMEQWIHFTSEISNHFQQSLVGEPFKTNIELQAGRDRHQISLAKFLRFEPGSNRSGNYAWIRCRGSSLLNFHCYGQWQMMFTKHPTGTIDLSPSIEILDMTSDDNIQFNSWYTVDDRVNLILETGMNYRRRYINLYLEILESEQITLDLESFSFANQRNTIEGFLRWIPKLISNTTDLSPVNNFELTNDSSVMLLTTTRVRQAEQDENISSDEVHYYYELKYENAFQDDDLDFSSQQVDDNDESSQLISVIQADLLAQTTDVIVICSTSKYLMDSVFTVGGRLLKASFDEKVNQNNKEAVISISATGSLKAKKIYFVPWAPSSNEDRLCRSLEQLVQNVITTAAGKNLQSIAFPAIGCGGYGCPTNLIAKTLVGECQQLVAKYPLSVVFVIQPEKVELYDEFRQYLGVSKHRQTTVKEPPISLRIANGLIEVKKDDITKQQVDVIIGSMSSENLRQILLKAAGDQAQSAYIKEQTATRNPSVIITPPGHLSCKSIFFFRWEPNKNKKILHQSIVDLIANIVQRVHAHRYTSIAFPALGCGEHACSVDIVVKTMVKEMKQQIEKNSLPWTVKFIVHPSQPHVYDEFCRQVLSSDGASNDYRLPSTWEPCDDEDQFRFIVPKNTDEYKQIISKFDEQMQGYYTEIVRLERIQNERWYMQFIAHKKDFKKRLGIDTEKRLYHGCPEQPANAIIRDCFNRSFAGVNGTVYGYGVYFSSRATYSHGYAVENEDGEHRMFVCRVLGGKTTKGDSSMKVRPIGFDSTTDGIHMTVTYHDAQAYAEYLITYK
ncbi:unnamed protein product [Adineta ricciae]|uniref:Poly [ADP-ribose] polymerase n=1 Tax=Adineta ricciae TaxID=249248 RepID=A0A815TB46_ADIRI|nr:unnamed protein product [Adineta ricciae]CAF1498743.1 unnamed protein product [Adineta ricciae]